MLKWVVYLTYRSLEGFAKTLMNILRIELPIPSDTQVSRSARKIKMPRLSQKKVTDVVVEASGLKIFGEGEWLAKMHRKSKRRRWRKIHIVVDPNSQEILMSGLIDENKSESKELSRLLKGINKPKRIYRHGATKKCYQEILDKGATPIIALRKRARIHSFPRALCRNHTTLEINGCGSILVGSSQKNPSSNDFLVQKKARKFFAIRHRAGFLERRHFYFEMTDLLKSFCIL